MAHLLKEERQQQILGILQENRQVTVAALSRRFEVSPGTVRRDLRALAERGVLRRTHGGAVELTQEPYQPSVVRRMARLQACKECIGRAAAGLVKDGQAVFIGSGTTAACVARFLADRDRLTVVTNAITVIHEMVSAKGVTLVMTGGIVRLDELSLVGHIAQYAMHEVRVDKVIMGIAAFDLQAGLTNEYLPEVITDRAIIHMADELIVVADHTKFGKVASAFVAPVDRVTTVVTDGDTDPKWLAGLSELGIRVVMAG